MDLHDEDSDNVSEVHTSEAEVQRRTDVFEKVFDLWRTRLLNELENAGAYEEAAKVRDVMGGVYIAAYDDVNSLPLKGIFQWLDQKLECMYCKDYKRNWREITESMPERVKKARSPYDSDEEELDWQQKEAVETVLETGLHAVLFDPSTEIRKLWTTSKGFRITDGYLRNIQVFANELKKTERDTGVPWSPVVLGIERCPKGVLEAAANKVNLKKETIETSLRRKRPSLFANILINSAINEHHDLIFAILASEKNNKWTSGAQDLIVKEANRIALEQCLPKVASVISESFDCFFEVAMNCIRRFTAQPKFMITEDEINLFRIAYCAMRVACIYNNKVGSDKLSRVNLPDYRATNADVVGPYMAHRIIQRGMMLTNVPEWLDGWVQELNEMFEKADEDALRFTVYQAHYFNNELDKTVWNGLGDPKSCLWIWEPKFMERIIAEAKKNSEEKIYNVSPAHRAVNLLRPAVYFKMCPESKLDNLSSQPRETMKKTIENAWLKPRGKGGELRSGVVASVNVDDVVRWLYDQF